MALTPDERRSVIEVAEVLNRNGYTGPAYQMLVALLDDLAVEEEQAQGAPRPFLRPSMTD